MKNRPAPLISQIKEYYRVLAASGRYATSPDFNMRDVEIEFLAKWMCDGIQILDAGCGNGYSTLCHAAMFKASFTGIDFVQEMIEEARILAKEFSIKGRVEFIFGDVTQLEFSNDSFDVVVSERCLMNLPERTAQWQAIREIARVLKPDGLYLMLEGTLQGLRRLNDIRALFGLEAIPERESNYNWFSNKFDENEMLSLAGNYFAKLEHIQRFGMYYFLSRVVHPLLVKPDQPMYDAPINKVARQICSQIPNFKDIGHIALFVFRK